MYNGRGNLPRITEECQIIQLAPPIYQYGVTQASIYTMHTYHSGPQGLLCVCILYGYHHPSIHPVGKVVILYIYHCIHNWYPAVYIMEHGIPGQRW